MAKSLPWADLRPPRLLLNVLLVGAFLRLAGLGAFPLWLDEGVTWSSAATPTWGETVVAETSQPPVGRLVTRVGMRLLGDDETGLRLPAALAGLLALWLTWCVMLRVLDPARAPRRGGFPTADDGGRGRRIAAWTTGLVAVLATFVEYAQEARMYPLLLAEALGLTLLYLRWLDGRRGALVPYALLGALALHTHYFALWVLLAHAVHALWLAHRRPPGEEAVRPLPLLAAVAAAGVLFLPWFGHLLAHHRGVARVGVDPVLALLYVPWRIGVGPALVVADPAREAAGALATAREAWAIVAASLLLWVAPLVLGVAALGRRPGLRSLVLVTLGVPAAGVLAIWPFFALIHERYAHFLAPWLVLLAVLGAFRLPRALRAAVLGGLALLALVGVAAYHGAPTTLVPEGEAGRLGEEVLPARFVPDPDTPVARLANAHPYGREPWRDVHAFVRRHAGGRDLVALHAWYLSLVWDYYATHDPRGRAPLDTLPLPEDVPSPSGVLERFQEVLANRDRVVLVLAHEETADPDAWIGALGGALGRAWFGQGAAGLQRVGPISFPWGIRVVIFSRR